MAKKLSWTNLSETFTNKKTQAAYKAYRDALDTMKEAQATFDDMLARDIAKADGVDAAHVVISHRFGLGYAVDTDAKPRGTAGKRSI